MYGTGDDNDVPMEAEDFHLPSTLVAAALMNIWACDRWQR